jgi:hypothetical protein
MNNFFAQAANRELIIPLLAGAVAAWQHVRAPRLLEQTA